LVALAKSLLLIRSTVSILLIGFLLLPSAGYMLWYSTNKSMIRKQIKTRMKTQLDLNQLVYLSFSKQELQSKLRWEHEHEFEYNNQMYDIIHSESCEDSVEFWCWLDHEETRLKQQLDEWTRGALEGDPCRNQVEHQLKQFLKNMVMPASPEPEQSTADRMRCALPGFSSYTDCCAMQPDPPPPRC